MCDHFQPREIAYNAWVCMYLNNIKKYLVFVVLGFLVNFSMEAFFFFLNAFYSRIDIRMIIRASCFETKLILRALD